MKRRINTWLSCLAEPIGRIVLVGVVSLSTFILSPTAVWAVTPPPCPDATWTQVVRTFKYGWNGSCCEAEIYACIKAGKINVTGIALVGDCWDLSPGTPSSILGDVINRGVEIIILEQFPIVAPGGGTIPNCPNMIAWTVQKFAGSCGTYVEMFEQREVNGVLQNVKVRTWFPCAENLCSQTCHACVSQENDPCNEGIPVLYFDCESTVSPGPCPPTGCTIPACSPMRYQP